jgi:putative spermidine/putrescine transport system permease protein
MRRSLYVAFLIVPIVLVVVFLLIPLVLSILPTFTKPNGGWLKYKTFFTDPFTRTIFFRSLRLSLITTLICVALGLPTSYYVSQLGANRKRILNSLILFPLLTNAVVRGFAWISILGKNGLLNQALLSLHLISSPKQMLYTEGAIVVGSVYLFLPTMISTLTPVMERIGSETIEAAYTLGARPLTTFFRIVVPLSFSGVLVASVMVFAGTISAYTTPTLLGGNKNMMLSTLLYQQSNTLSNWDAASLIAFIMILCSVGVMKIFNLLADRLDKRG